MIQVNEYFDGRVKSLTLNSNGNKATCGVMAAGEYEFSTGLEEILTVIAGAMTVQLPGAAGWQTFSAGQKFAVPANARFQLKIAVDTAYLCEFVAG